MKTIVAFDGQNLYHLAKNAWAPIPAVPGSPYGYPSYDVEQLAQALVARLPGRVLGQIRFYTGVPDPSHGRTQAFWHGFWNNKLRYLGSRGIYVYRGRINPGGQEKGVDVSLSVDLVELAYDRAYDAAIVVSQDWDFGAAVRQGALRRLPRPHRLSALKLAQSQVRVVSRSKVGSSAGWVLVKAGP